MKRKKFSPSPSKRRADETSCSNSEQDRDLIQKTLQGREEAFARLVEKYRTKVFRLAYQMTRNQETADDLTQETFIKVYYSLRKFQFRSSFGTWLYRVAANCIKDHLRKEAQMKRASAEELLENYPAQTDKIHERENLPETERRKQVVQEGIRSLPDKHRMIMTLRDIQGLAYKDIAQILNISEGTVDSRLFRARRMLRKKISPLIHSKGGRYAV